MPTWAKTASVRSSFQKTITGPTNSLKNVKRLDTFGARNPDLEVESLESYASCVLFGRNQH